MIRLEVKQVFAANVAGAGSWCQVQHICFLSYNNFVSPKSFELDQLHHYRVDQLSSSCLSLGILLLIVVFYSAGMHVVHNICHEHASEIYLRIRRVSPVWCHINLSTIDNIICTNFKLSSSISFNTGTDPLTLRWCLIHRVGGEWNWCFWFYP